MIKTQLEKLLKQSALLYALFLIPSGILLAYMGQSDASLSRHITGTWQAGFWHFPGLPSGAPSRVVLDILETVAIGALTWWFYQGFRLLSRTPESLTGNDSKVLFHTVLKWTLICGLLLIAVVPFHSSDLYGYFNRGFQQSVLHTNPYLTPIAGIPGWENQPLLHAHWVYNPCPYGFFFAQLILWLTKLSGPSFTLAFLGFKALNLLLVLGTTWLIYQLSQRIGIQRPWLSAYLFGANPLVLLHSMGNGHNDILLVFLLLASLWTLTGPKWRWASLPLLTLSILTKYASLLALPFIGLFLFKQRDYKALALGSLASFGLGVTLALPYIEPQQSWPLNAMLDNAGKPQHSLIDMLAQLIYYPTKWLTGNGDGLRDLALSILKPTFWLCFVLFYLWQMINAWKKPLSLNQLTYLIVLAITMMVVGISAKFHPWYPVMFLPVALLLPETSRLRQFGLTFSLFQVAGFTVFQNLPVFNVLVLTLLPLWLTLTGNSPFKPASTLPTVERNHPG